MTAQSNVSLTGFSRRALLLGAGVSAVGLSAGLAALPAMAKARMAATQAPAFYRFKIGDIEATVVSDGELSVGPPSTQLFGGVTQAALEKGLTDNLLPTDNIELEENALLLNTGDKLVLFDVGVGSAKAFGTKGGRILTNLKAAGYDPKDVDTIVLSHAHPDHCWGLIADDGTRNFPNAQIYMAEADLAFWTDEAKASDPAIGSMVGPTRSQLLPNRDRMVFVKDGGEVVPGVQALATPGHTVGHTSYMVTSGSKTLCLAADIAHHFVLTMSNPKVEFGFDTDPKQGVATRIRTLDMLAAQKVPTLFYHFPFPGVGHVAKRGDGYAFLPTPMQTVL